MLNEWIRLILIEAGYEEQNLGEGLKIFIKWDPDEYISWDVISEGYIKKWIKENK